MRDWADTGLAPTLMGIHGIGKVLRGKVLLENISFDILEGRCLAIMGPNGAGKSLLCRVLHGLVPTDHGDLTWQGAAMNPAARTEQAMVFQRPVMLRRSVRANLRFALSVRGFRGAARRRQEEQALEFSGLHHLAHQPARFLSGGEQQRLALARAMICQPKLLFLDEPTANLDPASTLAIEHLIRTAQDSGMAIVLITHDLGQARRLAQDLVFLQDGRVAERGLAAHCLTSPTSPALRAWCSGQIYIAPDKKAAQQ